MTGDPSKRSLTVALVAMATSPLVLHRRGAAAVAELHAPNVSSPIESGAVSDSAGPVRRAVARGGFGMLGDAIPSDDPVSQSS